LVSTVPKKSRGETWKLVPLFHPKEKKSCYGDFKVWGEAVYSSTEVLQKNARVLIHKKKSPKVEKTFALPTGGEDEREKKRKGVLFAKKKKTEKVKEKKTIGEPRKGDMKRSCSTSGSPNPEWGDVGPGYWSNW